MPGIIYKYTNKVNGLIYVGETDRPAKRHAQYMDVFNCETNEMVYDMHVLKHEFEREDLEKLDDRVNTKRERLRREEKWTRELHSADPAYGYNYKRWIGIMYGDLVLDAKYRNLPTIDVNFIPLPVSQSDIGKAFRYRWQHKYCNARERREDPQLRERIGILHTVNRSKLAIMPLAPLSRCPIEHVRLEDIIGLAAEEYQKGKMEKILP